MRHVLITGADGFIGRALVPQLLARGWRVSAIGRTRGIAAEATGAIERITVDLHDAVATRALLLERRPTHLAHLAWYTAHARFWDSAENLRWVCSSLSLLQAFREAGGRHAVLAGTCAEYDWAHGYCREELTPLAPRTLYGVSKNALHMLAESGFSADGLRVAWGRVFFPYGPGEAQPRLIPSVIGAILEGRPVRCSHATQYRDLLHVADVAGGFGTLLEAEAEGCFNIASGQPVQLREVVTRLAELLQWRGSPEFGALPTRGDDPPMLVGDNARLRQLGWEPRIDLIRGLQETITWWREQRHRGHEDER